MGKTNLQVVTALYNMAYNSLQAIIAYPSLDLAVETSNVKFIPLFAKIKQFQEDIKKPFAIRSDRLKLSNAVIYWQGAGTKIVSKSAKLVLGDECSIWQAGNNINNIQELKKRTRSYNECLQLFVSTPNFKENAFWQEFLLGSQGYYYLRCTHCHQLTMRSCDIHNLQFETVYNDELKQYQVIQGTQRLICPTCKHEHKEAQREQLVMQGAYIHKYPDRIASHASYQAGVLASLLNVHSWSAIADKQLACGKQSSLQELVSWDNSYRGLPYQERAYNKQDQTAISKHFFNPDDLKKQDIECVFISADTQDTFSPYGIFAVDRKSNLYALEIGRKRYLWLEDEERKIINSENARNNKPPEVTLLDLIDKEFYGIKPLCLLVDMRGHRTEQIKNFAKIRKNILMYGGSNLRYDSWKISENIPKLFLCDAKKLQADLIFRLYYQNNRDNNYLFLPDTLSQQDIEEITSFQSDKTIRNGNLYENWTPGDKVHDIFDVFKMALACLRIIPKIYKKQRFLVGQAKCLFNDNPIKKSLQTHKKTNIIRKPLFNY